MITLQCFALILTATLQLSFDHVVDKANRLTEVDGKLAEGF